MHRSSWPAGAPSCFPTGPTTAARSSAPRPWGWSYDKEKILRIKYEADLSRAACQKGHPERDGLFV